VTAFLLVAIPSLLGATLAVEVLDAHLGVPDASSVYLVAVVAAAIVSGAPGAVVTAVASFLLYNLLFTEPRFTLTVDDPGEWLGVSLLLFVGIVVGQLAALMRSRAEVARAREQEARALFRLARGLVTRESTAAALATLVRELAAETGMDRVWIALGADDAAERVVADTGTGERPSVPSVQSVLRRKHGDEPAEWVRVHRPARRIAVLPGHELYRTRVETGGTALGSIWALRDRAAGEPDRTETRLLAAASDQVGQVLAHDHLAAESQAAEVARLSDALKTALLQSVSHDLRTPLATIRAAAGTLRPGSGLSLEDQAESADAIDREVAYLDRLVSNLLDLSRIEAGALRADRDVFELEDLVGQTLARLGGRLADRTLEIELAAPPVVVDAVFLDEAVTNVLENALRHSPIDAPITVRAHELPGEPYVRLTIEDGGPGVPADALPRLFEKFYRVPTRTRGSRSGTGIGLAVVQGLVEAMGGRVRARRGDLGGLAIDVDLPEASVPAALTPADLAQATKASDAHP
jgi:two-component system, OmpR family, sensor histidine kinase KdpD